MNKLLITSAISIALSISACSEQKTPEQLIASANNYSEQGKFANAIIDFKNAVRAAPKNAHARLGLGRAYLNQGNYVSAEKELERAESLGRNFAEIAPLLAHVKAKLDKFSEIERIVKASEDLNDQDYLVVLSYAGISALSTGQITKAQDYFSQAGSIDKNAEYSQLASAYLDYSERNFAEGLSKVAAILTANPDFAEAKLLQGYLHFASKSYIEASQDFSGYIARYPLDYNVQFFQVNTLIKAQQFEQADKLANHLLNVFKKSPLALQYKAQIEYQNGNYIVAREFASRAAALDESFVIAKMVAGVSSYKLDELEQAYDYLIGLEDILPPTHPINVILLSIKIKLGETDDLATSVARLEALKNSDSDSDLLQITSLELVKIGSYANAQSLLNKAAQVTPNNARIKIKQGALLLTQGDLSGIQSLEQALTLDPSLHETEFALASQYIQNDEISKAQAIADKWLSSEKYQIPGHLLSGMIALKEEKELKAETDFNNALSLDHNNITALYGLASVYGFKKQAANAIAGYEKVLKINPNHYEAIRRYNSLQATQGSTAAAISFLNTLHEESKLNDRIHKNLVIGIALNLIRSNQQVDATSLLESIKNVNNLPIRYWSILANSYALNKQYEQAATFLGEGVKINPHSYSLRVAYIGALERIRKSSEALLITRQADIDFPNDAGLTTTLAYLELVNNNLEAAKEQLKLLSNQGVTNPLIITTTAKIAMIEKDYQQAITLYSAMYKKTPNALNIINLSRALQFSNQSVEAERAIENYLNDNNEDNKVRMLLAELYLKNNNSGDRLEKVISTYKEAIIVQPDNIVALNNLAWQEYLNNEFGSAQQHIEQAISVDPNEMVLQESYGVILVANEKFTQAIQVLTVIQDKGSVEVKAKIALAEAYIATNQLEKAKEILTGLSAHNNKVNAKIVQLRQSVSID